MIKTYEEFEDHLIALIKVRSRNYVNTDCDVNALIELVYTEIMGEVTLEWIKQPYEITSDIEFTIPDDNRSLELLVPTEIYGTVADVEYTDEDDSCVCGSYSIKKMLQEVEPNTFRFKSCDFHEDYIGKTIYFIRPVTTDLEHLNGRIYRIIASCMLEGIMMYIEGTIPSQVDTAVNNYAYNRYQVCKTRLINKYPQTNYVSQTYINGDDDGNIRIV